jgi:glycosyltransferase involved in cell wall biosynthesis
MKASVLINNYNYSQFLPETLASVTAQTHPPHEIIVVDDGSTDHSLEVLEQLRQPYPTLRVHAQPNGGQLSAMRAAIHLASGDWCCFLDADDTWEANHLAEAAKIIATEPDLGLYYSDHQETSGPPLYHSKWPAGIVGPCAGLVAASGTRIGTITSTLLLRLDFARLTVDIDEKYNSDWRTRADDCLIFGATLAGAICYYQPIKTVYYRIHNKNNFANDTRNSYSIYRYHLIKSRLFEAYFQRFGIAQHMLFKLLLNETSSENNQALYTKTRYRQVFCSCDKNLVQKIKGYFCTLGRT